MGVGHKGVCGPVGGGAGMLNVKESQWGNQVGGGAGGVQWERKCKVA